jgi:hypothetical protein
VHAKSSGSEFTSLNPKAEADNTLWILHVRQATYEAGAAGRKCALTQPDPTAAMAGWCMVDGID